MYPSNGNGHGRSRKGQDAFAALEGFSPELQRQLKERAMLSTLEAGSILFTEGQPVLSVAWVISGRLKLTRTSAQGRTLLIRITEHDEILSLSAALLRTPHVRSVEAIERAQLLLFEPEEFLQLMHRHADLAFYAVQSLSGAYHAVIDEASRLALSATVASRIAHLLLELVARDGRALHEQPTLTMPLRHEDIAFMAGTSRESVTRTLSDFRRRRILSVDGALITILQKKELERMV